MTEAPHHSNGPVLSLKGKASHPWIPSIQFGLACPDLAWYCSTLREKRKEVVL